MDFAPCPRCQEMNPPTVVKCTACGASMDEEPVEVKPLHLAQEPEPEPEPAAAPVAPGPPAATAVPPLAAVPGPPAPAPAPATGVPSRPPAAATVPPAPAVAARPVPAAAAPPRVAGAPSPPPAAERPHAAPSASAPRAELPPDAAAQAADLEQQITARPEAKGLYVKLADLYHLAGQKDAAAAVLERLLAVDPGNALARHRIDVLRGTVHHAAPAVAAVHPVTRPARPVARPAPRASSRRGLWIGLGVLALVLLAAGLWLLSGPS